MPGKVLLSVTNQKVKDQTTDRPNTLLDDGFMLHNFRLAVDRSHYKQREADYKLLESGR